MAPSGILRQTSVGAALAWLRARGASGLTTDSRRVKPGDAFIAWPGYGNDGRQFVPAALQAGAAACLVEAEGAEHFAFDAERVSSLAGLKAATGELADHFYGSPSETLRVVATTGTNGKTSTAWWTAQALSLLGQRCGVIGTLGVGEPPSAASPDAQVRHTGLTTPDPVTLHASFRAFLDEGFAACAIEASSIGIEEQRLSAVRIAVALFTNFTRDHLDYHRTMEAYWAAKARLFAWPGLRAASINLDDAQGAMLAESLRASSLDVWTYSLHAPARLRAKGLHYEAQGLAFTLHEEGAAPVPVQTQLIGDYNASNLLAVIGGLRALGVPLAEAARVSAALTSVPGRMQRVGDAARGPAVVVDYAHTPDALEKALLALRPFAQERGGRLVAVFGCGGNRDASKRPLMGGIAERLADRVIVTSDNPRLEAPGQILQDIAAGMTRPAERLEDRRAAISLAVNEASPNDVLLIAGKGHEDYQDIGGQKLPFSDVDEALAALQGRAAA